MDENSDKKSEVAPNRLCKQLAQVLNDNNDTGWLVADEVTRYVRRVARRHANRHVRRYCDSEDYAQCVWASIFRIAPRIQEIETDSQLLRLIGKMTQNRVIDEVRRQTVALRRDMVRTQELPMGINEIEFDSRIGNKTSAPEEDAYTREKWTSIVNSLGPVARRVANLKLEGQSHEEIAREVGLSPRSISRIIGRITACIERD